MRPSWRDGLVNAFPIPQEGTRVIPSLEHSKLDDLAKDVEHLQIFAGALQAGSFPFFDLPAELRNRVYALVLFRDKLPCRGGRKGSRLNVLMASKRVHREASYILYSSLSFRVFPLQEFDPLPLVQELPTHYRTLVTNLVMVVGSSWTAPPKTWRVTRSLAKCLKKMEAVQTLKIFVEVDPSEPMFAKYRISYDFYTNFCGNLLRDILNVMPQLRFVELDGNPAVEVHGPLVSRLRAEAEGKGKLIHWGTEGQWAHKA